MKKKKEAAHDGSFLLQGTSKWHCQNGERGLSDGKVLAFVFFYFQRPVIVPRSTGWTKSENGGKTPAHAQSWLIQCGPFLIKKTTKKAQNDAGFSTSLSFVSSSFAM